MESEELIQILNKVEKKGIGWDEVEKKIKVSQDILNLYTRSGPVPVTIINNLKKMLEEEKAA